MVAVVEVLEVVLADPCEESPTPIPAAAATATPTRMATVLPEIPDPFAAPVAGFASAFKTLVSEIVALAERDRNEDSTVSWNGPTLIGVSSSTVARPVASVRTEIDRRPFEKVTLGPSVGAEKVTDAPEIGVFRPSRTSTTG